MARDCTFSIAHVSPGSQRYRYRLCVQVQIMHNGEELPAAAGNVTDVGLVWLPGCLTGKNSPVPRRLRQTCPVSRKTLPLEVKRVARHPGYIPSRLEPARHSQSPLAHDDQYVAGRREVTAAARPAGLPGKQAFRKKSHQWRSPSGNGSAIFAFAIFGQFFAISGNVTVPDVT